MMRDFEAEEVLAGGRPIIDVRAPVEFAKGALPNSINAPILDDDQRHQVGICYKSRGPEAAVELGHTLVNSAAKQDRVALWAGLLEQHPDAVIGCFRGGDRSAFAQQWLADAGVRTGRLIGGYKAARRWLMSQGDHLVADAPPLLLGGRTGVGKTEILVQWPHIVDLERLANHRGSAFGRMLDPQPAQATFENALVLDWLTAAGPDRDIEVVMEDESRCVGSCALPGPLWDQMGDCPVMLLNDALDNRVARIVREYVVDRLHDLEQSADNPLDLLEAQLTDSLHRIRRRLGGERHQRLRQQVVDAIAHQRTGGDSAPHGIWVEALLVYYYDPMYDYQLSGKSRHIVAEGTAAELTRYLADRRADAATARAAGSLSS